MRIGIVCPYSFDVPGGVQFHIRDLATEFIRQGHAVSVLAPADEDTPVPDFVTTVGGSVPVHYNGSVARLSFGPVTAARTKRWLAEGDFDVVHVHEPIAPSLGMLALWLAKGPIVATFHSAQTHSRALQMASPLVRSMLEKITASIAVSEDARRTLVEHLGGDAVVIPNGVFVDTFASAEPRADWHGTPERPTIAFLGRINEPRKGLDVLFSAVPRIREAFPGLRVLVAGKGDAEPMLAPLAPKDRSAVELLGPVTDEEKASLLRSVDAYIAPQTGGESFGIVLVEAMSAGTAVISSDIGAFKRVLDEGELGWCFRNGDGEDLARVIGQALSDKTERVARIALASERVRQYDWSAVSARIMAVYEMARGTAGQGAYQ